MEDIFLSCLNLQNTSFFPMFRSLVIGLSCSEIRYRKKSPPPRRCEFNRAAPLLEDATTAPKR